MKLSKIPGMNRPKLMLGLVVVAVALVALLLNSVRGSSNMMTMQSQTVGTSGAEATADPTMKLAFAKLSAAHTDVCQDMGDKPAIDMYMNNLPSGSRLQGSCCSPMNMDKYVSQINSLKQYANIPQIPADPYDISKDSAMQMLGYYNDIQLNPAQQVIYDQAQKMTDDHGWCCCQCWAWYTHAGLAKYLISQQNFTTQQIVAVTNLEDCCGGA